jgi:hypothetical protein
LFDLKSFYTEFSYFLRNLKKILEKSCKIFEKWFSGSVGTNQNQTERLSQKPGPNHNQMFFEIRNQTQPKPDPN